MKKILLILTILALFITPVCAAGWHIAVFVTPVGAIRANRLNQVIFTVDVSWDDINPPPNLFMQVNLYNQSERYALQTLSTPIASRFFFTNLYVSNVTRWNFQIQILILSNGNSIYSQTFNESLPVQPA